MRVIYLSLSLFLFTNLTSNAQFTNWSFSGGFGIASYAGDLDHTGISNLRPAFNFETWYKLHENIQIKAGGSLYQLSADDHIASRNRGFRSNNYELYAAIMVVYPRNRLDFFTYIGGGITKVDPEGKNPGWYLDLPEYDIEGQKIKNPALIMPFGLGLRYKITPTFAVVLDGGYRLTNTDYLDGLSRKRIPLNELNQTAITYYKTISRSAEKIIENRNDTSAIAGGNPDLNDLYGMFTVKLQYILPTSGRSLNRALPTLRN